MRSATGERFRLRRTFCFLEAVTRRTAEADQIQSLGGKLFDPSQRCTLTRLFSQLGKEGHTFDEATIGQISPYIRDHVNRFGDYFLNMDRAQPLPTYDFGWKNKKFASAG